MRPSHELPPSLYRYAPISSVIETDLPGELILLDSASQQMFSLNETGRAIWRALPNKTVAGVVETLQERFDVPEEIASLEVQTLVKTLLDAGLIFPAND